MKSRTPSLHDLRKFHYYRVLNADSRFQSALAALFAELEALQPADRSAREWLLRPDFDWSEPLRAVEWARESGQKLAMAASMRLVQALAEDPDGDSPRARHAMSLIRDSEAQALAATGALLIVAFRDGWPLPADAAEDIADSFTIEPRIVELRAAPGPELDRVKTQDPRLERGAEQLARWALHGASWQEIAEPAHSPPERVKYEILDWAHDLGVHPCVAT